MQSCLIYIFSILLLVVSMCSPIESAFSETAKFHDNAYVLKAENIRLGELLGDIRGEYGVVVTGLESRLNEKLTFACEKTSIEDLFKALFLYLGERNYALRYSDQNLIRVSVLPQASVSHSATAANKVRSDESISVVEIHEILSDTQAQALGLMVGDVIVEYDGIGISSAQQLVKKVKQRSPAEQVEMTVVRERLPIRIILNGGIIGVRIKTVQISMEELEIYMLNK